LLKVHLSPREKSSWISSDDESKWLKLIDPQPVTQGRHRETTPVQLYTILTQTITDSEHKPEGYRRLVK